MKAQDSIQTLEIKDTQIPVIFEYSNLVPTGFIKLSFIGGGDTADAIDKAGQRDNMSFISTGGGASLELLEGNILPAFQVLDKK